MHTATMNILSAGELPTTDRCLCESRQRELEENITEDHPENVIRSVASTSNVYVLYAALINVTYFHGIILK